MPHKSDKKSPKHPQPNPFYIQRKFEGQQSLKEALVNLIRPTAKVRDRKERGKFTGKQPSTAVCPERTATRPRATASTPSRHCSVAT